MIKRVTREGRKKKRYKEGQVEDEGTTRRGIKKGYKRNVIRIKTRMGKTKETGQPEGKDR